MCELFGPAHAHATLHPTDRSFAGPDFNSRCPLSSRARILPSDTSYMKLTAGGISSTPRDPVLWASGVSAAGSAALAQLTDLLEGASVPGWTPPPVAPTIIAVLGAPGSGRSTQCASIASLLNGTCLSTSEATAAAVSVGTPVGEKVSSVLS